MSAYVHWNFDGRQVCLAQQDCVDVLERALLVLAFLGHNYLFSKAIVQALQRGLVRGEATASLLQSRANDVNDAIPILHRAIYDIQKTDPAIFDKSANQFNEMWKPYLDDLEANNGKD